MARATLAAIVASADDEQKRASGQNELLAAIVQSSDDAIISTTLDGTITSWNRGAERLYGYSAEEMIGTTGRQIVPPDRAGDSPKMAARIAAGERLEHFETVRVRKDGRLVEVSYSIAPLRDETGTVVGAAAVGRDVTERNRAALLNARLAAVVNSSNDAIIGKSLDGIIESWNSGAERIYGYTAAEAIGRHVSMLAPPERTDEMPELLNRLRRGERIQPFETVRMAKDGRRIDIALSLSAITRRDGTIVGVSAVGRDITDRKRATRDRLSAQLLETHKLESLGVLAGGVAHDFNNLLTSILGNASVALHELSPGSPGRHALDQIELAAARASELTRQMLAFAGQRRYVIESVTLTGVVEPMAGLMSSMLPERVELRLVLDRENPPVQADAAELRQVVLSLVTNAYEAIGERDGVITLRTGSILADGAYLDDCEQTEGATPGWYCVLEIADTGPGMEEMTRARIFEPFFTTKFIGRGLGLAAVLGIVRSHGGTIRVVTAPDHGASFTVLLPVSPESPIVQSRIG